MKASFYSLAAVLALVSGFAGCASKEETSPKDLAAVCAATLCRPPMTVHLDTDPGQVHETTFDRPLPIVIKGQAVTIYPGETLFIEGEVVGDRLVNLVAVEEMRDPARTLELTFYQMQSGDMVFTAINPFPQPLKYHLQMMLPTGDALHETSSCPVRGEGAFSLEQWPHPIFQLVLSEPHFEADASTCEY